MNTLKFVSWAACLLCCGAFAVLSGCATTSATTQIATDSQVGNVPVVETSMSESKESVFCNLKAMSPEERTRYNEVKAKIKAEKTSVEELPNGYTISLKADKEMIRNVGEFLTYEKSCCPFFEFAFNIKKDSMTLSITGPDDAKEILKGAFSL